MIMLAFNLSWMGWNWLPKFDWGDTVISSYVSVDWLCFGISVDIDSGNL